MWSNQRIHDELDKLNSSEAFLASSVMRTMRDEYEQAIETMREDTVRAAVAYESRIEIAEAKAHSYDALMSELYEMGMTVSGTIIDEEDEELYFEEPFDNIVKRTKHQVK